LRRSKASAPQPVHNQAMNANPTLMLQAPDIQPYRHSASGTDYVHVLDSGLPGPTVMVQALTHGNELCGAIALDWLFKQGMGRSVQPLMGKLILSFANVAAFERFDEQDPNASRCIDEDLNRVWADEVLFGTGDSLELRRARQLQPFVDSADLLFDIHSMQDACRPLMVCGLLDKGAAFARQLGMPGDLLIECGQHWEASSVDVAIDGLLRFLRLTGMVPPAWAEQHLRLALPERQQLIRVNEAVTALSPDFHFLFPVRGLDVIAAAGTAFAQDGDTVFRTQHDNTVLVMPSTKHGKRGNTMVRLGRFEQA